MKLFYRLMLLLAGLTFIASCSEDDFDQKPVLILQQETLSFSNQAEVKSVTVEINDKDKLLHVINSASGIDWIKVTDTEGGLSISVLKNETTAVREATVQLLLLKGSLTETISVSQAAGSYYIRVSKDRIDLKSVDSEATILIEANTEWTVSMGSAIDWLTIDESEKETNTLTFKATENAENKKRTAEIKVTGSGKECIVTVVQKGVMYYDFPLLQMGYIFEGAESERGMLYQNSLRDAHAFEIARGNTFSRRAANILYFYKTKSPIFPEVEYAIYDFDTPNKSVRMAVLPSPVIDPLELLKDPQFLEHLDDEGFEFMWRSDEFFNAVYWNKEKKIALDLLGADAYQSANHLIFTYARTKPDNPFEQADAHKTFDALPAFYTEWGATAEQVKAWEESKGSKFLPGDSDGEFILAFAPNQTLEPDVIERVYTMDKTVRPTKLIKTLLLLNHMEKAIYPTGALYAPEMPSNEYMALMLKNGYEYIGKIEHSPIFDFYNTPKSLLFRTVISRYKNEGFIPRLCVEISLVAPEDL